MGWVAGRLWRLLALLVLVQGGLRLWRKLAPGPRPAWFEAPPLMALSRLLWPPPVLLDRIGVQPGMQVVEVGAGTGALTVPLARAVGPAGHLLALDERPGLVEALRIATLEEGLTQVTVDSLAGLALPSAAGGCDLVVMTAVFGGLADKEGMIESVYRLLRPGGAVAVTELVTDLDYCLASTVVTHLVLGGFGIEGEVGGFFGYTIIGRKPGQITP
jgi:precorrin-6B methylase 2